MKFKKHTRVMIMLYYVTADHTYTTNNLPINLPTYLKMRSIHMIYWGFDGNSVWCCVWCGGWCGGWCVVVGVW